MDQRPEASKMTRRLAWAVAFLAVAGVVSAGVVAVRDDRPGSAVVTAARDRPGTVDVTSTVTAPLPPPSSTPPSTVRTTTTLPKAAVDVLNALGGNTTTTRPRATTTTRPPAPTTTVPTPTPTTAPPATTTIPPQPYTATLVNSHPHAFLLNINGREFPLTPGQTVESVELPVSPGGDVIQVRLAENPECGVFDKGVIFQPGTRYQVRIVEGPGMCRTFPSPFLEITRLR